MIKSLIHGPHFLKENTTRVTQPIQIQLYEFVKHDLGILKPLIKKDFITKHGVLFNEEIRYGEDFLFFLEILACKANAYLYPQPFYYYRAREGSLVTDKLNRIPKLLEEDIKLINSNRFEPEVIRALEERKRLLEHSLFSEGIKKELRKGRIHYFFMEIIKNPRSFIRMTRKFRRDIKRLLT